MRDDYSVIRQGQVMQLIKYFNDMVAQERSSPQLGRRNSMDLQRGPAEVRIEMIDVQVVDAEVSLTREMSVNCGDNSDSQSSLLCLYQGRVSQETLELVKQACAMEWRLQGVTRLQVLRAYGCGCLYAIGEASIGGGLLAGVICGGVWIARSLGYGEPVDIILLTKISFIGLP